MLGHVKYQCAGHQIYVALPLLQDSICEKSEGSLGDEHLDRVPRDRGFPENYLPKNTRETPRESSVEYLQAVAKVRLYLSKAAELLFDLHEGTGESNYSAV